MDHPILQALPSLHSTIIGILIAFYSAYFIYSFKEVDDAKTKLKKIIKTSAKASTPFLFYDSLPEYELTDSRNSLDWDKARNLIFKSLNMMNYRREKYSSDDLVEHVRKLRSIFTLFFTTYPMNGKNINEKINDEWKKVNESIFDYNRFIEIKDRINILSQFWDPNQDQLENLFNIYDVNLKERNEHVPSAVEHLNVFFTMVKNYERNIIPQLNDSILDFESSNERLKVKSNTITALIITIYILLTGVIFPLLLSKCDIVLGCEINLDTAEYTLLILSFLPYFIIIIFFLDKVTKTDFK